MTFEIVHTDFEEGMASLPDDSVTTIVTDPPYLALDLFSYYGLACLAKRVLKPRGHLIAYAGNAYLPQILRLLSLHLFYQTTITLLFSGGHPVCWKKLVNSHGRPVCVFVKTPFNGANDQIQYPRLNTVVRDRFDGKIFHKWQQGVQFPRYIIEKTTQEGDLVVDPFLGSGTVAQVCKELNRDFIGFDNDKSAIETAQIRLNQPMISDFF